MKRYKVTQVSNGAFLEYEAQSPLDWTAMGFGLPEHWDEQPMEGVDTREVEVTPAISAQLDEEGNEIIPAFPATYRTEYLHPSQYSVEETDITAAHNADLIAAYTAIKDKECDDAVKALLAPSEDVTHIMIALYDFFVVMNIDGTSSQQDIDASKESLIQMRNLMGQIQMLRATRDADVQAYIDSLE